MQLGIQILSGTFIFLAYVPYLYSIFHETTKPNRVSWFVWAATGMIILLSYRELGGKAAIAIALLGAVCPLIIALISIVYGTGGTSVIDRLCIVLIHITCLVWILTGSAIYPYLFSLIIDFLAMFPTFRKTYLHPESEHPLAWFLWLCGAVTSLFAATTWRSTEILLPVYLIVVEVIELGLLFRKK
jgi:hypothetical protein